MHQLSISDVKMLLLTRKIGKANKVRNVFYLHYRRNSRHFSKLGDWCGVRPRACLLRFSAVKLRPTSVLCFSVCNYEAKIVLARRVLHVIALLALLNPSNMFM